MVLVGNYLYIGVSEFSNPGMYIVDPVKNELVGEKVIKSLKPGEQFVKVVHERLLKFLGAQSDDSGFVLQIPSKLPSR